MRSNRHGNYETNSREQDLREQFGDDLHNKSCGNTNQGTWDEYIRDREQHVMV